MAQQYHSQGNAREMKIHVYTKICTRMFTAALLMNAKMQKQPKGPATEK